MEPSIFTKIIRGEIPCHKIYEDEKTLAFLDIHPMMPGHTLVVPKTQVSAMQDLSDDDYIALMTTVKKVMQRQAQFFGSDYKICLKVMGFDVPHAHVHVLACHNAGEYYAPEDLTSEPDHQALAKMAEELKLI